MPRNLGPRPPDLGSGEGNHTSINLRAGYFRRWDPVSISRPCNPKKEIVGELLSETMASGLGCTCYSSLSFVL